MPRSTDSHDPVLTGCLETVRGLESVRASFARSTEPGADGQLDLELPYSGTHERFFVQITRTHLSHALASGFIEAARRQQSPMLFAPYVPAKIGQELTDGRLSYVDAIGNCHITLGRGRGLIAHIEGRKPSRAPSARTAGRVPSYKLIFAILAQPRLLDASVRDVARAAGIGKTAAADNLKRLSMQGFIAHSRAGATLVRKRELLERWLAGYADVLRPSTVLGTYRPQVSDPDALERRITEAWTDRIWAFGGGAAAWRMAHHYRGPETVVHAESAGPDALRELRAIPARDGSLIVLRATGTLAYEGLAAHLAHPLLVYAEMVISSDPRMREAAQEIRDQFLSEGP